jgi:hypothetical protein
VPAAPELPEEDAAPQRDRPAISPKIRRKLAVIAAARKLEEHTRGKPGLHSFLGCCPVCGEEVSAKAPLCPSCGHPISTFGHVAKVTVMALLVVNVWVGVIFILGRMAGAW